MKRRLFAAQKSHNSNQTKDLYTAATDGFHTDDLVLWVVEEGPAGLEELAKDTHKLVIPESLGRNVLQGSDGVAH